MAKDIKRTVYLSESEYAEISKKMKGVKEYPNPYIKECGNVRYQIIPDGETFTANVLTEDEKAWFAFSPTDEEVVMLSISILGWFPTELIAGTDNGRFSMNTTLSEKTGWVSAKGTLGSRSALFLKSKVNVAIDILNEYGFKFKKIKQ